MPKFIPSKPRHWIAIAATATVFAVLIVISGLLPFSRLNSWVQDVDIHAGRMRDQRYLLRCLVSEQVRDTWITDSLAPKMRDRTRPKWKRSNTFTPLRSNPTIHSYHGAIEQIQALKQAHSTIPFDPAARRTAARRVLGMWRNTGSAASAQAYVDAITQTAQDLAKTPASAITTTDLP